MRKNKKSITRFLFIGFLLTSCGPTEAEKTKQTSVAISETSGLLITTPIAIPTSAPTTTLSITNTPTPAPTIPPEIVRVEELNPVLWWFIVRDQQGVGTYKRIMAGEYRLVRDKNNRIIKAYNSKGDQVDAILFPKGGYGFEWEGTLENKGDIGSSIFRYGG